jgi:hypothetical protein
MSRRLAEALKNSQGKVFYGMHFYPGVAQYDTDEGSFRVFINEQTIRKMNPSFEARPVFVQHVMEVEQDLTQLRNDADGWVVESFFNEADGKTWVKFIIVSDEGFKAIQKGYKLSNAYLPDLVDKKATWNGVDYQKEVTGGEFEHLALVQNPRYEESVIMTPDQFKAYNTKLKAELYRLANSKTPNNKGESTMKLKFFNRKPVENAVDIENTIVELPKSKKEISIAQLVNDHDTFLNMQGYANGDHMVKVNDKDEMSVNDLLKAYHSKCAENEKLNAKGEDGGEPGKGEDDLNPGDVKENEVQSEDDMGEHEEDGDPSLDNAEGDGEGDRDDNGDKSLDNVEDEDGGEGKKDRPGKDAFEKKSATKNAADKAAAKKIADAKARAARLKNAHLNSRDNMEEARIDLSEDQVARGKSRYGSN